MPKLGPGVRFRTGSMKKSLEVSSGRHAGRRSEIIVSRIGVGSMPALEVVDVTNILNVLA